MTTDSLAAHAASLLAGAALPEARDLAAGAGDAEDAAIAALREGWKAGQ